MLYIYDTIYCGKIVFSKVSAISPRIYGPYYARFDAKKISVYGNSYRNQDVNPFKYIDRFSYTSKALMLEMNINSKYLLNYAGKGP